MESKKKRIMVFGIFALAVLLIIGGTTYAFFFTNDFGQTKNETVTMTAGTMSLEFSDLEGASLKIEKTLWFGDTVEKTFQIKNTGTLDAYAKISWDNLVNTYLPQSLSYTLQYKTNEDGEYQEVKTSRRNIPTSESSNRVLADSLLIPAGETYYYLLTIKLENLPTIDQTQDLKAVFSTKLILGEGKIPSTSVMKSRSGYSSTEMIWGHSTDIKKVVFEDTMNLKTNATYTYDISLKQDESVMSYLVPTEKDNTKYTLYIQGEHGVVATSNSSFLFYNFTNLESIDGLEYFDTSDVTNMNYMFGGCSNLASLNVSNFNTSKATNMSQMFQNCNKLTSLDLSNFDTSKVTDMNSMFQECRGLTSLNLSQFNTSKVTNMSYMFHCCNSLISLDISNFDTSNVTNIEYMFARCSNLSSIDVSNFNTSNVISMRGIFSDCSNLTSINVSSFDTSNVTNIGVMFYNCSSLTSLDISNFDTSNVTNMDGMFQGCHSLTSLDASNFDTSKVTDMSYMFSSCSILTSLDVSNFDTSNVTTMGSMFQDCSSLTSLNISGFNTSNVSNSTGMFSNTSSSLKITIHNDELKQWVIDASSNPKLTESNITVA